MRGSFVNFFKYLRNFLQIYEAHFFVLLRSIAPMFETVVKPNSWDRKIKNKVRTVGEQSELSIWRFEFWQRLIEIHQE